MLGFLLFVIYLLSQLATGRSSASCNNYPHTGIFVLCYNILINSKAMFLKHKPVQVIDDCVMHRDVYHDFEFVRYSTAYPPEERIIVRVRCTTCNDTKLNGWDYYRVSPEYWLGFLVEHRQVDFTSAN